MLQNPSHAHSQADRSPCRDTVTRTVDQGQTNKVIGQFCNGQQLRLLQTRNTRGRYRN